VTNALIYHDVAPAAEFERCGFGGPAAARYKLDPERFEAHLAAIAATAVPVGLIHDGAPAALTFDDGGASAMRIAGRLESRGWRGHFFITTGRIGTPGFLSAEEVRELGRRGHVVGSHSHSHPTYMGALGRDQLAEEWRLSRELLQEILGYPPDVAAVPGGFLSAELIAEAARAGYRMLLTSQPTSRATRHGPMLVQGRFTIWSATSPGRAAAYVRGDRLARFSLWLAWQAKTAPKRLSPRTYEVLRQNWARAHRRRQAPR
jgi:peptidoglycan/xylan/chitin deacetylase (PgdA/CDA1 family)